MSMTIACPSCGSKRRLDANSMGLKIQCDCGVEFSVSPVFAVPEDEGGPLKRLTKLFSAGPGPQGRSNVWTAAGVLLLFAGTGAVAAWLMTRPQAAQPDPRTKPTDLIAGSSGTSPRPDGVVPATTHPAAGEFVGPPKPPAVAPPPAVKPTPPPPPTPVESLRVVKLWDAFDLDPERARTKYTGQLVEITAPGQVQRDDEGRWYFGAQVVQKGSKPANRLSPQEQRWEKDGYPPNVRCYLAPGQAPALGLEPKTDCVLRGVCVGRKDDARVYMGYVVILENCVAVPQDR